MSFWKKDKKYMKGIAYRKTKLLFKRNSSSIKLNVVKCPRRAVLSASMTLEAVFIFPLVLFFSVILIHVVNLINFQNRVNEIMYDTSRNLSKLEYVVEGSANQVTALAMLWADLGDASKSVGVAGGNSGLVALQSDFDGDEVDFIVNYVVKTPFDFLNVLDYSCCQRAYVRKWIGNEDKGGGSGENTDDDSMVYITENGTVYHLDRNCTHISLSIKTISKSQVEDLRNVNGSKYYSCEMCGKDNGSNVLYITDTGTKYHTNINCSGLKRAVYTVPLSQVISWSRCSRCG